MPALKTFRTTSWLHRLLRIEPGKLPRWFLDTGGCESFAVADIVLLACVLLPVSLIVVATPGALPWFVQRPAILIGAFVVVIAIPDLLLNGPETAERKTRARIRQTRELELAGVSHVIDSGDGGASDSR